MALPLDELIAAPHLIHERAQEWSWDDLLFEYERALDDIQALLAGLTDQQAHFKPASRAYSISEIVTQNAHVDKLILDQIKQLAADQPVESSPAAGLQDGATDEPSLDGLRGLIESCRSSARALVVDLPESPNLDAMTSHPDFGALNAKGWFYFLSVQRGLQLRQAEAVIDTPGFPHDASQADKQPADYLDVPLRKPMLPARTNKRSAKAHKPKARAQSAKASMPRKKSAGKRRPK